MTGLLIMLKRLIMVRRLIMPLRLIGESEGQNIVEYALLAAVVALGAVAALNGFQNVITNVWAAISNNIAGGP